MTDGEVITVEHTHEPVFRVVRRDWADPLNGSFSQRRTDNRWNTSEFPALYCCCSELVARAVVLDIFRFAGVEWDDLRPGFRPELTAIAWRGLVADVASPEGVTGNGFSAAYPENADKASTRRAAVRWREAGIGGVVCRSASMARMQFRAWNGSHERWSELAIFIGMGDVRPALVSRRSDREWLRLRVRGSSESSFET